MEYKMREDGTAGVPSSFTLRQVLLAQKEKGGIAPALGLCVHKKVKYFYSPVSIMIASENEPGLK